MDFFDKHIQTEFLSDITNDFIEKKREIDGYNYNMFQSTIIKDGIEYYCERINVNSEINNNGVNGLFFANNKDDITRFEGKHIDAEDPRLFICNNKIYVIFNAIHPMQPNKRYMAISEYDHFDPIYLKIKGENENDHENKIEKNWSPCVIDNKLYLIYLFDPLIILHFDFNSDGFCYITYKQNPDMDISSINISNKCLRGSSNFIPYVSGVLGEFYIGLCHSYINNDDQHYYFAFVCIINVTEWKIVYISKPIACRSVLIDNITKYKDTDIICNHNRYYYKNTFNGNTHSMDIHVVYPTSIYKLFDSNDEEYIIILNLNKYSIKNKMTIDNIAILQKIIEQFSPSFPINEDSWENIVRKYSMDLLISM
jgi:hypothetical protein